MEIEIRIEMKIEMKMENTDLTRIRDAEREVASSKWVALIAAAEAKGVFLQV